MTTGGISGRAVDAEGGGLPGVTITAVHQPTNTTYDAVTDEEGRFRIINAKVGGPYVVRAELEGFEPGQENTAVALGQTTDITLQLGLVAASEEIVVTAEAVDLINPNRSGSTSSLSQEQIQSFPTVRRNIMLDGARTNPYASIRASDENQKDISFAGRSSKYNNIQIDGSNYNDLFGLGESGGTPGGQTNAQPVQQDVVAELQVGVSPYDVRQSGFTGGVINAVTKSGTNDWHGLGLLRRARSGLRRRRPFRHADQELRRGADRRLARRPDRSRPSVLLRRRRNERQERGQRLLGRRLDRPAVRQARRRRPPAEHPAVEVRLRLGRPRRRSDRHRERPPLRPPRLERPHRAPAHRALQLGRCPQATTF